MSNYFKLNFSLLDNSTYSRNLRLHKTNFKGNVSLQLYALNDGYIGHGYERLISSWTKLYFKNTLSEIWNIYSEYIKEIGKDLFIVQSFDGIQIYILKNTEFILIMNDEHFHSLLNWFENGSFILIGHCLQNNKLGLFTKNHFFGLEFFQLNIDVMNGKNIEAFEPIDILDLDQLDYPEQDKVEYRFLRIDNTGYDYLTVRRIYGVYIYKINNEDILKNVFNISCCGTLSDNPEKIFFQNVISKDNPLKDIIFINETGLFLFKYNPHLKDYIFINYNSLFSKLKGWNENYINTIFFKDINSDERQDMLFTGPQGISAISYDIDSNTWLSLLDNSQLTIQQKRSKIITTLKDESLIFTRNAENIFAAKIETVNLPELPEEENHKEVINVYSNEVSNMPTINTDIIDQEDELINVSIQNHIDISNIIEGVDRFSGKIKFNLPLIDIKNFPIKFSIHYSANNNGTNLGLGWKIYENAIEVDTLGSVFTTNHLFYMISNNNMEVLMYDLEKSTNSIDFFKILGRESGNDTARYFKKKERWEVKIGKSRKMYGHIEGKNKSGNAIIWTIGKKNWQGPIKFELADHQYPIAWYLSEEVDEQGNTLEYIYNTINVEIKPGKFFTREIYLSEVKDLIGNKLKFAYNNKSNEEYKISSYIDSSGLLNIKTAFTKYLECINIKSTTFWQEMFFIYQLENDVRKLLEITERNFGTIFKFSYDQNNQLYFVDTSMKVSVKYKFQTLEITQNLPTGKIIPQYKEYQKVYKVNTNKYTVSHGNGYLMLTFVEHKLLNMIITNLNMNQTMYSTNFNYSLMKLPKLKIMDENEKHEVVITQQYIVIKLFDCKYKMMKMYIFRWIEDRLTIRPKCIVLNSREAMTSYGNDFIIASDTSQQILLIQWNKNCYKWDIIQIENDHIEMMPIILAVSNTMFALYDDEILQIFYRDQLYKWRNKLVKHEPNIFSKSLESLNNIKSLPSEDEFNMMYNHIKYKTLQILDNILILNCWRTNITKVMKPKIEDFDEGFIFTVPILKSYQIGKYITDIYIYKLDQDYNVEKFWKKNVENNQYISESNKKIFEFYKNYVNIYYRWRELDNENYLLTRFNYEVTGALMDQLKKTKKNEEAKTNLTRDAGELIKNYSPLEYDSFFIKLEGHSIICDKINFTFNGDDWFVGVAKIKKKRGEGIIELAENVYIQKELEEPPDIGTAISNLYITTIKGSEPKKLGKMIKYSNLVNNYDVYFGYSNDNTTIIKEYNKVSDNFITADDKFVWINDEKISSMSTQLVLVTELSSKSDKEKELKIKLRPFKIEENKKIISSQVVTRIILTFDDNRERLTGYSYNESKAIVEPDESIHYEQVSILSGDDKLNFGWIDMLNKPYGVVQEIYNSKGDLLKIVKPTNYTDQQKKEDNNQLKNSTLFDRNGILEVAQFFPNEIANGDISYYGFEIYENNKIGHQQIKEKNLNQWNFHNEDIVKKNFSFTGENYLKLSGKRTLKGTFNTSSKNQFYIASCWIRPHTVVDSKISPYLKAIVSGEYQDQEAEILGKEKWRLEEWLYLEVIIDLKYAELLILNGGNMKEIKTNKTNLQMKTIIKLEPIGNVSIDVDHIRFSPLDSIFEAKVYDSKTKKLKQIIQNNGLIKRYIYDEYLEETAIIDEHGQIEQFHTYTRPRDFNVPLIDHPKCNIDIKPENGFVEEFSSIAFIDRWKITNSNNFHISPGKILHKSKTIDKLILNEDYLKKTSFGIRFMYILKENNSSFSINNIKLERIKTTAIFQYLIKKNHVQKSGELLFVLEGKRIFVWVNGALYIDEVSDTAKITSVIILKGKILLKDILVLNNLKIALTYFNAFGDKIQELNMVNENTTLITNFLYDELNRQSIFTKKVNINRLRTETLLAFYNNFITNNDPYSNISVWKIGELQGYGVEILSLDKQDFYQVKYWDNPLDEEMILGMPGKEFSINGTYSKYFEHSIDNIFINENYPKSEGFTYNIELKAGGIKDILIYDKNENKVARYVINPVGFHHLTTYKYNDKNQLIQVLPPLYHHKMGTLYKDNSSFIPKPENDETKMLQRYLGTEMKYNEAQQITEIRRSDSGAIKYIYDENELLRFNIYFNYPNDLNILSVIYFDYDQFGRIVSTGTITHIPKEESHLLNITINSTNSKIYQEFLYSDFEEEPLLRGRLKRITTANEYRSYIEEILTNANEKQRSRRVIIPIDNNSNNETSSSSYVLAVNKKFNGDNLLEIEYPVSFEDETFRLTYQYNKQGLISAIGLPNIEDLFGIFTYTPAGKVYNVTHIPHSPNNFTRHFSYNSADFITKLVDKYLEEKVLYTEGSYGGFGYGDGTITRTEFSATWHDYSDMNGIGLDESSFLNEYINLDESQICFDHLKKNGYIDQFNRQIKIYYPNLATSMPIICKDGNIKWHIAKILGEKGFPRNYGHSYDYGNYMELTKAKYFLGTEDTTPLQPNSFAKEIQNMGFNSSYEIWQLLIDKKYILSDKDKVNASMDHGKEGKSFFRPSLLDDLKDIDGNLRNMYFLSLKQLLINRRAQRQSLYHTEFVDIFRQWSDGISWNDLDKVTNKIWKILDDNKKDYLSKPFTDEYTNLLKNYTEFLPDVTQVLINHFATQLGEAEFDVESYDIDLNGNHKLFYTGFNRYELSYHNNTNRINKVKILSFLPFWKEKIFDVEHDDRGNVIKALHKGILKIEYNPVLNRADKVYLSDNHKVSFSYDSKGERILKKVFNGRDEVIKEVHYIRDEEGRSLVEKQVTYMPGDLPPDILVTAYIYGPNELYGFIRRDEFYSIISDHEGSTRLVVKNGEVVAAYDYMPYGQLMRIYGDNPEYHVQYRYTGQEWDEELKLYNYHARFYDPDIGRFYQLDPKEQYACPYKYSGNSPVALIDPTGEVAFFIIFIGVIVGLAVAYISAAAVNGFQWNFLKWNWSDPNTYFALFNGFIQGFTFVITFGVKAFIDLAVGEVRGYLTIAEKYGWDVTKWNFKDPELYMRFLGGLTQGMGFSNVFSGKGIEAALTLAETTFNVGIKLLTQDFDPTSPTFWNDLLFGSVSTNFKDAYKIGKAIGSLRGTMKNIKKQITSVKYFFRKDTWKQLFKKGNLLRIFNKVRTTAENLLENVGAPILNIASELLPENKDLQIATKAINTYFKSKNAYKKTKGKINEVQSKKRIDNNIKNVERSEKEAREVIDHYKSIMEKMKNNKNLEITENKGGSVPNTKLTMIKGKNFVIGEFQNKEKGELKIIVNRKKGIYNIRNKSSKNKIIALGEGDFTTSDVEKGISEMQMKLKKDNLEKFNSNKDSMRKKYFDKYNSLKSDLSNGIMDDLGNKVKDQGYVTKKEIKEIVDRRLQNDVQKRYKNLQNDDLDENIAKIKLIEMEKVAKQQSKELTKNLWKDAKTYEQSINRWFPKNNYANNEEIGYNFIKNSVNPYNTYNMNEMQFKYSTECETNPLVCLNYIINGAAYQISTNRSLVKSLGNNSIQLKKKLFKRNIKGIEKIQNIGFIKDQQIDNNSNCYTNNVDDCETVIQLAINKASKNKGAFNLVFPWLVVHFDQLIRKPLNTLYQYVTRDYSYAELSTTNNCGDRSSTSRTTSQLNNIDCTQFDMNNTLLLVDVLLAKKFNRQLFNQSIINESSSNLETLCFAMGITEKFENKINAYSAKYGIDLDLDFVKIQSEILEKLRGGKFDEIVSVLNAELFQAIRRSYPVVVLQDEILFDIWKKLVMSKLDG